jgi:activator of HSP90 ATPase
MAESIEVSTFLPGISAERIYRSWLDSEEHSAFTGSPAQIDPGVGGKFSAWDGYIYGRTLVAEPFRRILQAWHTTEFPQHSPDSRLEILFEEADNGAQITLIHTDLPDGQGEDYRQGWEEFYFEPMQRYFSAGSDH